MQLNRSLPAALSLIALSTLTACGGGGGGSPQSATSTPQSAPVSVLLTDASAEDWATIGVKVMSIALVPQGGGAAVTVYTAPSPAPTINLAQLDQLAEILGNVSVPVGTYSAVQVTLSGNPGDVSLTAAADPETGFPLAAGTSVDPSAIQIQGTQGTAGNLTVPLTLTLSSPLVVSTSASNALDLEFDLSHPAFIVEHVPAGGGSAVWAVNFDGPVRYRHLGDLTRLVLRHTYGAVQSVSSDGSTLTIGKLLPTEPPVSPAETSVATGQNLSLKVDNTNGTLFYDIDAKTSSRITSLGTVASALTSGRFVRVAARYQSDGSLWLTRVWVANNFNEVWLSPEGHVVHVDTATHQFVVSDEQGKGVPITVDANTQFFFRTPKSGLSDTTPIGTGTGFLDSGDLLRGFKVHVQAVDPLAASLTAQTVDIETAAIGGRISAPTATGMTYTRSFATATDDYSLTLPFIASTSANGTDGSGNAVTGFKYWDFAYPTVVTSGAGAIASFDSAVGGTVNFGGTFGAVPAYGMSYVRWGDSANPSGWSTPWTVIEPTPLPRGTVTTGYNAASNSFTLSESGGTTPVTVSVGTTPGSATLVYQVDRSAGGVVSVSHQDVTTTTGLASVSAALTAGAKVQIDGVPQADGSLHADVLTYFTGVKPN